MSAIRKLAKEALRFSRATDDFDYLRRAIDAAELVSFDVFDTLISRDVIEPSGVFEIVARRAANEGITIEPDWGKKRVEAEYRAREVTAREEITLAEIYQQLTESFEANTLERLKELEVEAEIDCCRVNKPIFQAFRYAIESGMHVVLTSDMYLPRKVLERILVKNEVTGYERLYLSSELMHSKRYGSLFEDVKLEYKGCESFLHIGDHPRVDYLNSKRHGFKAILTPGTRLHLEYWRRPKSGDEIESRIIASVLSACSSGDGCLSEAVGREVLGPILLGYCLWLREQIQDYGAEKIVFLAREGKLYKQAYELLFPEHSIPTTYLMVSRRALAVPRLAHARTWDDVLRCLHPFLRNDKLSIVGEICGCTEDELNKVCATCGVDPSDSAHEVGEYVGERLYEQIIVTRVNRYSQQERLIKEYLAQEGISGKVILSDVGYGGTMQKLIGDYLGSTCELHGRYLGVHDSENDRSMEAMDRRGYLFDKDHGAWADDIRRFTNSVFEFLMLNPNGSVRSYIRGGNSVHAITGSSEYDEKSTSLSNEIQCAALSFLREVKKHPLFDCLRLVDSDDVMGSYYNCFGHPSKELIDMLSVVKYEDGSVDGVVATDRHELAHPGQLKRDFDRHHSKALFLASLFGGKVPWIRLLSLANKFGIKSTYRRTYIDQIAEKKVGKD